uniref:Uncharacterized protein n=1 Tax=Myoviridae sp. ct3Pt8 TaxID=2826608 RepID=A0A8S5MM94_9CAUD|nr:MAG TPA: hypothetical protein [Myoviridae sp. ct3Pt8]
MKQNVSSLTILKNSKRKYNFYYCIHTFLLTL